MKTWVVVGCAALLVVEALVVRPWGLPFWLSWVVSWVLVAVPMGAGILLFHR